MSVYKKKHSASLKHHNAKQAKHTSADRRHSLRVIRAVYVEAADVLGCGDNCERLKLFTAGAILRGVKACGAGAGLLIVWLGQTEVGTAPVVGAAGVARSCRVCKRERKRV